VTSVYNLTGNKQIGFQFARYGVEDLGASIVEARIESLENSS